MLGSAFSEVSSCVNYIVVVSVVIWPWRHCRVFDFQDKSGAKNSSSDTEVSSRNPPTSRTSDADKPATETTRLPFTSSLASTLHSDKSRTLSTDSDAELRAADRPADCIRTDTVRQNGIDPSTNPTSRSPVFGADPVSIPSVGTANGSVPPPTLSNNLSQKEAENFVAQWTGDSTQLVGGRTAAQSDSVTAPAAASQTDDGWYYCDPQGQIQGQTLLGYVL